METYAASRTNIMEAFERMAARLETGSEKWHGLRRVQGEFLRELDKVILETFHSEREETQQHA